MPDRRRARAPRLLLLGRRPAGRGDPGRAGSPTSTPTRTTRAAHERTTGPEIWAQTDGRVTHFVAGIGTGGTITGTGRYLKEVSGGDVQIIGADPEGSVYSGGTGRPVPRRGCRRGLLADHLRPVDRRPRSSRSATRDSFLTTRRLAREEGLLIGGSCGLGGRGRAARRRRSSTADDVVVVLLPDCGRGYLSKIYNDDWMADYGFLARPTAPQPTVGDVLHRKGRELPELVHVHPDETVGAAIAILREYGVSPDAGRQGTSRRSWPPRSSGSGARSATCSTPCSPTGPRSTRPLARAHEPRAAAGRRRRAGAGGRWPRWRAAAAVLVLDDGQPVGMVTRSDVLGFLAWREVPCA